MGAPASPEQAEIVRSDIVRLTLDLAPETFDYVVVDTASSFNENSLIALELAQNIVLPLTADMASLKTAVSTMRILKAVKIDDSKIRILLNEIVPRAGLTEEQVEAGLGRAPDLIPHAGSAFIEASNQGMPLVTLHPPPPAARAIIELASTVCIPEEMEAALPKTRIGQVRQRLGLERLRRT
jgi:pilus assembly protein CpaE